MSMRLIMTCRFTYSNPSWVCVPALKLPTALLIFSHSFWLVQLHQTTRYSFGILTFNRWDVRLSQSRRDRVRTQLQPTQREKLPRRKIKRKTHTERKRKQIKWNQKEEWRGLSVGLTEDVGADGRDQVARENQRQGRQQHERHLELALHHGCWIYSERAESKQKRDKKENIEDKAKRAWENPIFNDRVTGKKDDAADCEESKRNRIWLFLN